MVLLSWVAAAAVLVVHVDGVPDTFGVSDDHGFAMW
jgi:hypothetical protein